MTGYLPNQLSPLAVLLTWLQDTALYDGRQVPYCRKAQALVSDLAARLGERDERFKFADLDKLTADSGG